MLFDLSEFRKPLPTGVLVFASGANRESEIRGFARLGISVGVSVAYLYAERRRPRQLNRYDDLGCGSPVVRGKLCQPAKHGNKSWKYATTWRHCA